MESVVEKRVRLLREATERLARLLADPHPGSISWMTMVPRAVEEINAIMDGKRD